MLIRFTKGRDKPNTIACVRDLLLRWYTLDEGERLELSFDSTF